MRAPRWTKKEIERIDAAKAAVERRFGIPVGLLSTGKVTPTEVRLSTREGVQLRHRLEGSEWVTEALIAPRGSPSARSLQCAEGRGIARNDR